MSLFVRLKKRGRLFCKYFAKKKVHRSDVPKSACDGLCAAVNAFFVQSRIKIYVSPTVLPIVVRIQFISKDVLDFKMLP